MPKATVADDGTQEEGYEVTSALSLSPDWQILSTSISKAPTFEAEGGGGGGGWMLRVEGVEMDEDEAAVEGSGGAGKKDDAEESIDVLLERFEKRMETLRAVVEAGKHEAVSGEEAAGETETEVTAEGAEGAEATEATEEVSG